MFKSFREKINNVIKKISGSANEEIKDNENLNSGQINKKENVNKTKKDDFNKEEKANQEIVKKDEEKDYRENNENDKKSANNPKIIIKENDFDNIFFEIEMVLLENNVAIEVVNKIKDELYQKLKSQKIPRRRLGEKIKETLKQVISEVLSFDVPDLLELSNKKKPFKLLFVGINGSGKTTTISKIAKMFKDYGKSVVLVASDTFRAAAIQQLEHHANNLDLKIIKHDYGADPAAVAFDAVKYSNAHDIDVILVDTAGRLHTNNNLMEELRKIKRVIKPDMVIYIGEAITGNDCVEQAKQYDNEIGIDALILTKTDIDEKGGASLSISYVTKKPILFLGNGQEYGDLKKFEKEKIIDYLGI